MNVTLTSRICSLARRLSQLFRLSPSPSHPATCGVTNNPASCGIFAYYSPTAYIPMSRRFLLPSARGVASLTHDNLGKHDIFCDRRPPVNVNPDPNMIIELDDEDSIKLDTSDEILRPRPDLPIELDDAGSKEVDTSSRQDHQPRPDLPIEGDDAGSKESDTSSEQTHRKQVALLTFLIAASVSSDTASAKDEKSAIHGEERWGATFEEYVRTCSLSRSKSWLADLYISDSSVSRTTMNPVHGQFPATSPQ